ncbi:hypothetical protein Oweho_1223 [Owenweeksia hongkongensis DSM 17368]|uniref:Beta-ketoacyl synthase-like N-terminal domain-containing protein n=1 Tax=Owenweeksia hongkongensis (strain DSM 17368 / CIP 108786 / JCM 12287 / NRRL B-23963 / UST20020801) TaxID=926562 RepID=G8R638_OWEHD|nr:beta-ketoacyl synthase chain length factor [Owenweeksia hongkongensis]AEV32228.1 hypothetical protein Oweho_1223 [Owenweeksia hongkongensis DSM 17368]
MYIGKSACISYQNTIADEALELLPISKMEEVTVIEPSYKELIKPALLRRMSSVLKMGTYAAMNCLGGGKIDPEAIIVGTGLGCVRDTISFLNQSIINDEQTLAPTAFIQSTHNSIGGQIALLLQNYRYNMTMVQNSVSFEMALLDAQLQLEIENLHHILVGGVDELTPELSELLKQLADKLGAQLPQLGQGSAFFNVSQSPNEETIAKVNLIETRQHFDGDFISTIGLDLSRYDLILNGGFNENLFPKEASVINFKEYCGEYFTAPAFASYLALQAIEGKLANMKNVSRVIVLNKFGNNYGAIGLERFDL